MVGQEVTVNGIKGKVKSIRLRDDGTEIARVRLDNGPLLVVPVKQLTGQSAKPTGLGAGGAAQKSGGKTDEAPGET